jgi:hypothetical protein
VGGVLERDGLVRVRDRLLYCSFVLSIVLYPDETEVCFWKSFGSELYKRHLFTLFLIHYWDIVSAGLG